MASEPSVQGTAPMDYAEHERTYDMFVGLTKWGTIAIVAILVMMAFFLV